MVSAGFPVLAILYNNLMKEDQTRSLQKSSKEYQKQISEAKVTMAAPVLIPTALCYPNYPATIVDTEVETLFLIA